jgi:hypothetical protein
MEKPGTAVSVLPPPVRVVVAVFSIDIDILSSVVPAFKPHYQAALNPLLNSEEPTTRNQTRPETSLPVGCAKLAAPVGCAVGCASWLRCWSHCWRRLAVGRVVGRIIAVGRIVAAGRALRRWLYCLAALSVALSLSHYYVTALVG